MSGSSLRRACGVVGAAVILMGVSVIVQAQQTTFTKWVTKWPDLGGVVSGDIGDGWFAGEVLKYVDGPTTLIEATYHLSGSMHTFTALVHVEQTGLKGVITGIVTDGWLKGKQVQGEYLQINSSQSPDGIAYQGTLIILTPK